MHTSRYLMFATSTALLASVAPHARAQVTASGGEVVGMSQKNVVDHMLTADSIEIEEAQLAVSRTKNASVRDLANLLITDHRKNLDELQKIAAKPSIGRAKGAGDTVGAHGARVLAQLNATTSDSAFDRAFVTEQVDSHKQEIDQLKKLRAATADPDLQKNIDQTVTTLEQHLARAQMVAGQLATPAPDTMAKRPPVAPSAPNAAAAPDSATKQPAATATTPTQPTAAGVTTKQASGADSTTKHAPVADSTAKKPPVRDTTVKKPPVS